MPRDPLKGMPEYIRADFDRQPRPIREAYIAWFQAREDSQSAHRDCWPAFLGGWRGSIKAQALSVPPYNHSRNPGVAQAAR